MTRGIRALALTVVAVGLAALAPAAAQADMPITSLSATPASAQAGGHSDFTLDMAFGGTGTVKDLVIHLPAGVIGNPNAATPCTLAQFDGGSQSACPPASRVGTTTVAATALGLPITATGEVYILEPGDGQTALLGIDVLPTGLFGLVTQHIRLKSPVSLRRDGGLDSTITGIPNTAQLTLGGSTQQRITSMSLILSAQANGNSFITLPTSCGANTTTVEATNHEEAGTASRSDAFTTTGCGNVPFTPGVETTVESTRISSNTGVTVALTVPGGDTANIRQSHISRTDVVLPVGMGLNPGLAATVTACTDAEFDKEIPGPSHCPASSQIGTVKLDTPVLGTVNGVVYLGAPTPESLLRIFVMVQKPERGVYVKLSGTNTLDPANGQVTATFDGLPQIPFTRFELSFAGGDHSVLTTPPTCGPATTTARLVPYSGAPSATVTSTFQVSADGAGAPCGDAQPFTPTLTASVDPTTAGSATTNAVTLARHDGDQLIQDVTVSMPPGLAGSLKGVPFCEESLAKAGLCSADSQVGVVQAQAGVGNAPLVLDGRVYLVGPGDGALARLAIVLPGAVGPFDFGSVVSFAALGIRPADGGLDVVTKNLPTTLQGIPLNLRQLTLTLNRPGFARNATSCALQQIHATFTSTVGTVAGSDAPYQATDCDKLAFAPKVSLTATGDLAKGGRPALKVGVTQADGQAAARKVTVKLPAAVTDELFHSDRQICSVRQQASGQPCPAASKIGTARADTSLLPIPLTGDVMLLATTGGLPSLSITLQPLGITVVGLITSEKGQVVNTFDHLPDTPLSNFELNLNGGRQGILASTVDLCTGKSVAEGTFVGHNGATATASGTLQAVGCTGARAGKQATASATYRRLGTRKATLTVSARAAKGGRKLSRIRFAVPKGVSLRTLSRKRFAAGPKGAKVRKVGRSTVEVRAPKKAGAATISILLKATAIRTTKKSRRTLTVSAYDTSGTKTAIKVTAKKKKK